MRIGSKRIEIDPVSRRFRIVALRLEIRIRGENDGLNVGKTDGVVVFGFVAVSVGDSYDRQRRDNAYGDDEFHEREASEVGFPFA